jgi:hypothetical protein
MNTFLTFLKTIWRGEKNLASHLYRLQRDPFTWVKLSAFTAWQNARFDILPTYIHACSRRSRLTNIHCQQNAGKTTNGEMVDLLQCNKRDKIYQHVGTCTCMYKISKFFKIFFLTMKILQKCDFSIINWAYRDSCSSQSIKITVEGEQNSWFCDPFYFKK